MDPITALIPGGLLASLTWADAVVLAVVVLSAGVGFLSGFVWQILRMVSVVVAFWVAARFHGALAGHVAGDVADPARLALSFAGLFVAVVVAGYLLMLLIREPVNAMKPEPADRILGAFFGVLKGLLICGVVALTLLHYGGEHTAARKLVRGSVSATFTARCVRSLWCAVSGGASGKFGEALK